MSDSLGPIESSPGQNVGVGSLSLLQEVFPTQESNRGLLHCRWILYQLSYEGSPLVKYEKEILLSLGDKESHTVF